MALNTIYSPWSILPDATAMVGVNFEHFACPMVHLVTEVMISSYKKLMHYPAKAKVWQTAFGKDFGGMTQGDDKMGQERTNAMFVMTHDDVVGQRQKNYSREPSGWLLPPKRGSTLDLHHCWQ